MSVTAPCCEVLLPSDDQRRSRHQQRYAESPLAVQGDFPETEHPEVVEQDAGCQLGRYDRGHGGRRADARDSDNRHGDEEGTEQTAAQFPPCCTANPPQITLTEEEDHYQQNHGPYRKGDA